MKLADINNQILIENKNFNADHFSAGANSVLNIFLPVLIERSNLKYDKFPTLIVSKNTKAYRWLITILFEKLKFIDDKIIYNNLIEIKESPIQLGDFTIIFESVNDKNEQCYFNYTIQNMILHNI